VESEIIMHLQIEMEGKMKPVLTFDSPEIENKTVACLPNS